MYCPRCKLNVHGIWKDPDAKEIRKTTGAKRWLLEEAQIMFGIPVEAIVGNMRPAEYVRARASVVWVAREIMVMSFPEIGRMINRHHASVHHLVGRVKESEERLSDAHALGEALKSRVKQENAAEKAMKEAS